MRPVPKSISDYATLAFNVVSVLVILVGGILWMGAQDSRGKENAKDIAEVKRKFEVLESIDQRLSRIEGRLGVSVKQ